MRVVLQAAVGFAIVALAIAPAVAEAATAQQIGVQHAAVSRSVQAASSDGKKPLGVVPHRGAAAPGAAAPTGGRPAPGYDNPPITGALAYHSGRVMHSSTVRTMFWDPTTLPPGASHFGANYASLINQFVGDVAADSPHTSNVFGSDMQYTDSTLGHITGNIAYGGTYTDTNSFPDTSGFRAECFAPAPCITDTQLETELRTVVIPANGWPTHSWTDSYAIMTPPGVNVCIDWAGGDACSTNAFCAYHTWGDLPAPANNPIEIYAVEPSFGYDGSCDLTFDGYPQGPNGDIADITINTLSHELNEDITDPTGGGWWEPNGGENGDKCAWNFGYRLGSTVNGDYNQVVNGHKYLLQREWSNALNGCYQNGVPTISSFAPGHASVGDNVVITGTNFFWSCSTIGMPCFVGGGTTPVVKFNGIVSPSVTVDSPTQLTATVPNGAVTGKITVQGTVAGNVVSAQTFGLQPAVTGFTPGAGFAGQVITVNGTGFFGVTSVKINGVAGPVSAIAANGTSLHVTIPAAATTGKISVTTAGGTGTSAADLTVQPHVTAVTPLAAIAGSNVTIAGTGLGGATVDFANHTGAQIVSQTGTSIVVKVPNDAHNGQLTVHTTGGDSTSVATFKPLMKILSFDAANYQVGNPVTVTGSNFLATGLDPTAKLGANVLVVGPVTETTFQFTIPDNGITASVSATNGNGTTTSPTTLKVRPTITGDPAPNQAAAGAHIIFTGKTFTGTTSVKFNGTVPGTFVIGLGGTSLNVTVPAAAVDGPISVTNAGGPTATSNPFLVDGKVTSFTPLSAKGGANVTINGTGFGASPVVDFTGSALPAPIVSHTATSIVAQVPADAHNGTITVHLAHNDASNVTVFKPLMKITGFDALNYQVGETVTVTGSNFLATGSNPTAKLGALAVAMGPVTETSFQFTVPDNGLTGTVSATNANGTTTSPVTLKVRPTITGDPAPNDGFAGAHIVLTGKTFTGTTAVKFGDNTQAAPFTIGIGGTTLNVTVPAAATTGHIGVTNAGGTTQTLNNFIVHPHVTSFSPLVGVAGSNVTIAGTGFGSSSSVDFSGSPGAGIVSHTATSIVVHVPTDATIGPLTVHADGDSTSAASFKPVPKITGFDAPSYQVGNTVTVSGSNFTANGTLTAKLGAVSVTAGSVTATSFQFAIPVNGLTSSVTATNLDGTATSPATLKVKPTIDGDPAPNDGIAGAHVVLSGKTFTGTTAVKFGDNTQAAPFTIGIGGTTLNVTVPATATTGHIGVTNAGGTTQTANSFVVHPRISSFTPVSGAVGAAMVLSGSGLAGADAVNFGGGVTGVPTAVTATSLHVVVPPGALTGTLTVHTASGGTSAASATPFTVSFSVTSISPTFGNYNSDVVVNGVGLTGVTAVKFNGVTGTIQPGGTATQLHVHAPASGTINGHVTIWKSAVSILAPQDFTLVGIDLFTPDHGLPGDPVGIDGHGFTGATQVQFNGTAATFTVDSDTHISTSVPVGALSGPLSVTVPAGTVTSTNSFTIGP